MSFIINVPWIVISLVIYNIIVMIFGGDPSDAGNAGLLGRSIFTATNLSGAEWSFRLGDLIMALTLLLLFLEIIKISAHGGFSVSDTLLSTLLFTVCLVEFLTVRQAATSVFFVILMVSLIDVIAGFVISVRFASRDLSIAPSGS